MKTKRFDCPQCGAAITDEKCPYCGAVFYDFSAITISEPCYIKVCAKIGGKDMLIRMKVVPEVMDLTMKPQYDEYEDWTGDTHRRLVAVNGRVDMSFRMLQQLGTDELYTIQEV